MDHLETIAWWRIKTPKCIGGLGDKRKESKCDLHHSDYWQISQHPVCDILPGTCRERSQRRTCLGCFHPKLVSNKFE
jgi:hypothetical protein